MSEVRGIGGLMLQGVVLGPVLREGRTVRIVAGKERLQSDLRGFVCRSGCEFENGRRVSFGIVRSGVEQVEFRLRRKP
jgi:hypothetical protein